MCCDWAIKWHWKEVWQSCHELKQHEPKKWHSRKADLNTLTRCVINQSSNVIWCVINRTEAPAAIPLANSDCSSRMDYKKRVARICNSNKMRSILLRNVFVLCTYLIYPSVEKYKVFCEMGIAIAITLIETIIDQMVMSSKYMEPIAMR